MNRKNQKSTPAGRGRAEADSREDRLKVALKANLARRKAQSRARSAESEPETGADGGNGQG